MALHPLVAVGKTMDMVERDFMKLETPMSVMHSRLLDIGSPLMCKILRLVVLI